MGIGTNIKKLREMYQLSQKDLARIAGVSDKAVSTWENDIKEPRMGAISKMAAYFGIKKSNIIEEDGLSDIKLQIADSFDPYSGLTSDEITAMEQYKRFLITQRNETSASGE